MSQKSALGSAAQFGLMHQPQLDVGFGQLVEQHDRISHTAGHSIQRDGVEAVDTAEINDLPEFLHGRSVECGAGLSFIIESLAAPMPVSLADRISEVLADLKLGVAG